MDYAIVALATALLAASAGCVRIGVAFARGERWADKVLFGVYAYLALIGIAGAVVLARNLWNWLFC